MGQYNGNSIWQDLIYQFEETDLVTGGPDGIDNKPLQQLADRTAWLKNSLGQIQRFLDIKTINTPATITKADGGKLFKLVSGDNMAVTLDDVGSFPLGTIVPFSARITTNSAGKAITLQPYGGQKITGGPDDRSVIYICNGERIWLVAAGDHWEIVLDKGNFWDAGDGFFARKQRGNTVISQGQLVNRADFPRLVDFVNSLTYGQEVVPEGSWLGDIRYRGCYSYGDGNTTIRLPDERGMFERALDLGRGIDYERLHNYAGGYEADENRVHSHGLTLIHGNGYTGSPNSSIIGNGYNNPQGYGYNTNDAGGAESRPKNLGKIPLIKY